jgi:acyl carrier protein
MILDVVREAVTVVLELPAPRVAGEVRWVADLGADSLAMIEIVEVAEELLRRRGREVRVDDDTLAGLVTVDDLVSALGGGRS